MEQLTFAKLRPPWLVLDLPRNILEMIFSKYVQKLEKYMFFGKICILLWAGMKCEALLSALYIK